MPERLDRFMACANAAYYARHDPFADFTTAPEIGQVFGELIGAWAATVWQGMGAPDPVLLAEAGPGRGTLMADARRATARVAPAFHAASHLHLIETSPRLRREQALLLPGASFHDAIDTFPEGPTILIANEFLDALPIRQFVRRGDRWAERWVEDGRFVEQPHGPAANAPDLTGHAEEGAIFENSPAARDWVACLARRLAAQGGAALILDYGPAESGAGESFQAIRHGRPADPLAAPGSADLTAHVDFAAIAHVAEACGARRHGPVTQGAFLGALGLAIRTERLASANPNRAAALREAADRLAHPARMGSLFKALCITHPDLPAPPGFA